MTGERFNGEVHVLLDFGRILHRVRARYPHPFVQRDADAVGELLQRDGSVGVVIVFRELLGDIGRRVARLQLFEAGIHRVVHLAVQIDLFTGHLRAVGSAALEATHEVDEVAGGTDGVDVNDDEVALADELVGRPSSVGAGVPARRHDDVVDDFAAALEHELVHLGFDLALADTGLQPLVLDLPHRRVADARRLLQQLDLVAGLHGAGARHRGPTVDDLQAGLLECLEGGHVEVVDADLFLFDAVLLEHFNNAVGHAARHVRNGALGPLPGNGRTDAPFHPGQVDLGALHVGPRGFEQRWFALGWNHGVPDIN